jgi:c(7)-type cytochrome triheme protein
MEIFPLDGDFALTIDYFYIDVFYSKGSVAIYPILKGGKDLRKKVWTAAIISICIVCFMALGVAYAQQKKVGGGDVVFEAKTSKLSPVTFSHENHVNKAKNKCTDCHTKIFPMKKQELKNAQAAFAEGKLCGTCHDGKKAFSATAQADCVKCHKK